MVSLQAHRCSNGRGAMTVTRKAPTLLLAACILFPACNQDEEALVAPRNGTWSYQETEEISNTCNSDLQLDPLTTFALDYDGGETFDIERGADDIHCEIDGYDFTCGKILVGTVDLAPAFDAMVSFSVTYDGTFDSEEDAVGRETVDVTCEGSACETQLVDVVPCRTQVRFSATFQAG